MVPCWMKNVEEDLKSSASLIHINAVMFWPQCWSYFWFEYADIIKIYFHQFFQGKSWVYVLNLKILNFYKLFLIQETVS